jgi:hypothetical protein
VPGTRLTYRPLEVERLQGFFDTQAGIRCGLDPPPGLVEAGCLQRAWDRFLTRVHLLKESFGQLLPSELHTAQQLWKELRRGMGSTEQMLGFLARSTPSTASGANMSCTPRRALEQLRQLKETLRSSRLCHWNFPSWKSSKSLTAWWPKFWVERPSSTIAVWTRLCRSWSYPSNAPAAERLSSTSEQRGQPPKEQGRLPPLFLYGS